MKLVFVKELANFMATSALGEAIRAPLPTLTSGFRFWRQFGARVYRAKALCQRADALRFRRYRDWSRRSDRLYLGVIDELTGLVVLDGFETGSLDTTFDRARAAHRALSLARRPFRLFGWSLLLWAFAACALAALVLLLSTAVSPALRHRVFPRDLAQGQPWSASSGYAGFPTQGMGPASDKPNFFHTNDTAGPWLEIDLGGDHLVRSLLIVNRSDCCQERAIPLNVEASVDGDWTLIAQRRAPFSSWKYDVDPIRTNRIRVRLPGHGFLHLKRVAVYGE